MECDICGDNVYHLKYDKEDRKSKCADCFYPIEVEREAPDVQEWEPSTLRYFMIKDLPENWPGRQYKDGQWTVKCNNARHEKETMDMLGIHWGEKGETISNNGKLEYNDVGTGNRVYSFLGHGKANTCR